MFASPRVSPEIFGSNETFLLCNLLFLGLAASTFVNPQILLSVVPLAVCGVLLVGEKTSLFPKKLA